MKLYTYFRSSAAWRVRIALALKGISTDHEFIHLLKNGGQQRTAAFRAVNPMGLVPALVLDNGTVLTQSLAIMEYLEEAHPEPPLLPRDPEARARVRAFALGVACEIHPLNNLRILRYLKDPMEQSNSARDEWYRHWIAEGLTALETTVRDTGPGPFLFGGTPSMADVCLVPQMANARRLNCPVDLYPTLLRAEAAALAVPAFRHSAPDRQPDAE